MADFDLDPTRGELSISEAFWGSWNQRIVHFERTNIEGFSWVSSLLYFDLYDFRGYCYYGFVDDISYGL